MFRFRRWWLLCGAVLVGVVALNGVVNGVVDAKAAPAPRAVCVRGGAKARDAVSGRGLVCVQTRVRGLRWRFQPTTVTPTTTSPTLPTTMTVPGVVAPVLVSVSASDGVQITVAGMRPDTGVYSLQWVPYGQTFNTYQMARATSPSMSVPVGWFACNRTYTFRVFVMQAGWQLADGHQTQNVTPHSTPFDVVMPACPAATVPAVACADGGVCVVGDTGPGGGIVFYVASSNFTSTGSDCNTTCKYLEAAPSDQSTGIVWATNAAFCYDSGGTTATNDCQANSVYSGDSTAQAASRTAATAIGKGMANTNQIYARLTTAGGVLTSSYAAGIAYAYSNSGKTDWHLPSKDESNQLYINRLAVGGFSTGYYWTSSELAADNAWNQYFSSDFQGYAGKNPTFSLRPVRAFGGTVACADGGVCVVGDTGPGGGIVFYVASSNFTSTGSDCNTTCKYLEAAPSDQSTGIVWATNAAFCYDSGGTTATNDCKANSVYSGDSTAQAASRTAATELGKGMANTNQIYARLTTAGGVLTSSYAAGIAYAYSNSGKTDWHLPSKDELNELCKYARTQTTGDTAVICANTGTLLVGFSTGLYWSSSENNASNAWGQVFLNGSQGGNGKSDSTKKMRPVRAFG